MSDDFNVHLHPFTPLSTPTIHPPLPPPTVHLHCQVRHTHGIQPRSAGSQGGLSHSRAMSATLRQAEHEVVVRRRRGLPVHEEISRGAIEYGPWRKEVVVQVGDREPWRKEVVVQVRNDGQEIWGM